MTTSLWRKAVALPLAWVMTVTSMLWAAPPTTVFASPAPHPVPYVYVEPPLLALARAFEEALTSQTPEPPLPLSPLPRRVAAFAFGADSFTRSPYTKVVQGGANFLYAASRGYGYTDVDGLDETPNNRGVFSGPAEIYDQLIGAKPAGAGIVFRADVPNGTYRFVAAGGDPKYGDHLTTVRVRDGGSGEAVGLVENFRNLNREFWRVGFDRNVPPTDGALFLPLSDSPALTVTSGFVEVHQIAGTGSGISAGGDLNLIELWLTGAPPAPADPPEGLVRAFAFGADDFTLSYYTKIVQGGENFLYDQTRGFGYSNVSGLDTSPNNRGFLGGSAELYDQFIGAKPGGASIVFRVNVPNGHYRLVLAGGDVEFENHKTTILARDGSSGQGGKTTTLVDGLANPMNEFYRIGFEERAPPFTSAVNFLPLSASPVIEVTQGFLEIHQIAGAGAGAGGDLCLLEIWQAAPVVPPPDFVAAFAFGADSYTRSHYTKVVQDGLNFLYDQGRGYGYTGVSGLDTTPNNRGVLPAEDEIYDQFIGAKPGGTSIVFRVDVPPGEYRFVAAGGDAQYPNHKTSIRLRDGSLGSFVSLVEDLENTAKGFYRAGFGEKHAPSAASVNFLPEIVSPTLTVTSGYLEVHQIAGAGFAAGGDLSIFEIWRAGTMVPPSVSIVSPTEGAFFTGPDVPVRVTFTAFTESVAVLIDGADRTSELALTPGVLEGTLALGDGVHEIRAGAVTHGFTVDLEPPVLTIDPPAPYVRATPLVVTGTMSDRDPAAVADCPSATLEAGRFTCTFPLGEGLNALTVRASDRGGRETTASASVTLDTEAPEITILSPTPDTYTMASTIDVNGGVFDDSPVTVRVDSVDAVVNGNNFAATGVPIGTASNLIRVVATDAAGNVNEATVTVLFDAEPPLVTLNSPVDGAILPSPLTVAGTVADTAPVILVDVNGQPVMVENGSFTTTLTALDGPLAIVATAQDAAGNPGTAEVTVRVDSTAPDVSVVSPLDGAVTNATPISIQGSVVDDTAVSLTLNGTPMGSGFPIEAPLSKGPNVLEIVATDAAGNSSSVSLGVVLDTDAPELRIVSPSEGELLVSLPVLVQGTVDDATEAAVFVNGTPAMRVGNAWQLEIDSFPGEGPQTFTVVATDAAGNSATSTRSATLDTTPPAISITTPAAGFLTREAAVAVTGTVEGADSVTVNGSPATVTGGVFFASAALGDGDNPIRAVATDAAGRSTEAVVVVTQDAIPPTLNLVAPETLSGITSGRVIAGASDNLALAEVILRVNGETRGIFTGPPFEPFEMNLVLPDGAAPGDTLVVSAEAADILGNRTTSSRGVIVIEDGVIAGQVLDDKTSLPIEGASVTMGSRTVLTGARGQYSLPTGDADVVIRIDKPGMTSVERRTSVLADVGTVPVDARLTPLTGDHTEISPQGLPALLPLGWSPLSAFQVTSPATVPVPGNAYLAQYRFSLHEWVMLSLEGPLDFELPEAGSYAVVLPDPEVSAPAPSEILEGVEVQILPASVTTESQVEPAVLPPSGGIAAGSLSVFSPVPLPSGTVIQAEITEIFTLASGDVASEETRYEDIVLYRNADDSLAASFPITSSLSAGLEDVVSGEVNLDLLAGREAVRGERGGSKALTVDEGDFRLSVPGSSLAEDTAISLRTFDSASFDTLAEVFVDLSGQVLSMGAELSMAADGLSPDDTYILARIVRIDGVPRMEFVSLATLASGRLSASGVRAQGSYVFYRSFSPVGFVAGLASAPGAVVETSGLPFVALSDAAGQYRAVALTGPVTVTAYVPRSSLRATASADVLEGETTILDLTLSGQMTTATVTPGDGALGVAITTQIDISSSAPLAPGPVVRLLEAGAPVLVRLVLSGSGKSLAVIPEENLKHETPYTLEAATLADVFGGAVVIPQTTFTTGSKEVLSADPDDVTFSLPDDNGIVEVSAFGLPPGTTVLLVNSGNGIVVSFTYVADGVLGEIPASISDRILVTLTDPAGSVVTFEKSKFVGADGTTAIGPGGGTVEGPGGVELRIPEGALPQGVELKIRSVAASEFPIDQRPLLPGGTLASGLEVQAPSIPQFETEVKLAFPKPADAPEGAFFYVYRKHETETGEVLWETIDHAFIEGDKVVTASLPFAGLVATYAALSLFVVVWTYAASRLDKATTGTVTGKVLRTVFQAGTAAPSFAEIPGVDVFGVDLTGKKTGTFAISQKDGTYTFFDETFRDGLVRVRATVGDLTQEATAYKINVEDDGPSQLRFYENVATANLTFPPVAPRPPPPSIGVVIFKKTPDGSREKTDGLVVESDTLVIGFTTKDTIQQASINGDVFNVRREFDTGVDWVLDQDFTPGRPGTFLIETTALGADGSIADVAVTFRAIAAGGSNNDTLHDEAPSVITLKTVPKNDATGVPVDIFPQLTFTEPVTNVPGNVSLVDSDGQPVGFVLSGVGPDGPIADVSSAGAKVTSLTLQPMTGLKFGKRYTLSLASGIEDLDEDSTGAPAPKNLVPFTSSFTTFGPESLGGTEDRFGSAGIVVLEDRAFLVENNFFNGTLRAFDITDPVDPQEIVEAQAGVDGRPVDLAGETGMVVVATGPTNRSRPSNLYLFDVTSETESRWVGAASVASSAQDGFVQRVDLLDGLAYVLTGRRGVQVVDLQKAAELLEVETGGVEFSSGYFSVRQRLNTAGQGFGQQAVNQPIPLPKDSNRGWFQQDLAVSRIQANVWVGTTGEAPLILVNPTTRTSSVAQVDLITGSSIELGQVKGRDLALIAGWGSIAGADPGWAFAVVDLSQPATPFTLGIISLPLETQPTDILLTEDVAIVASENEAGLVNLQDPAHPLFAGTIDMVGGALALADSGLLLSTARSAFGGDTDQGGVNTAALQSLTYFRRITPRVFALKEGANTKPIDMEIGIVPQDLEVDSAVVDLYQDGVAIASLPVTFNSPGRTVLPPGVQFNPSSLYEVQSVINRGQPGKELISIKKSLRPAELEFANTAEIEVSDPEKSPFDLVKIFDERPHVVIEDVQVDDPGFFLGGSVEVSGRVTSVIAPVPSVWLGRTELSVNQINTGPDGRGPFIGEFSGSEFYDGSTDALITVTAKNALGHFGWDSVWLRVNPDSSGNPVKVPAKSMESVPRAAPEATSHAFRLEVKDRGLLEEGAVRVVLDTGVEKKEIRLFRRGNVFRSDELFLVPDSFVVPTDFPESFTRQIASTRLRGKLGVKVRAEYVVSEGIDDEAISTGVTLVGDDGEKLNFVPGQVMAPVVTITDYEIFPTSRDARVSGTVEDPVAKVFAGALRPTVTANGISVNLGDHQEGIYSFSTTLNVPLPLPISLLQVRAENAIGGVDSMGLLVNFEDELGIHNPPLVENIHLPSMVEGIPISLPQTPGIPDIRFTTPTKPFRVKFFGPEMDPADISGKLEGVLSQDFGTAIEPIPLGFESQGEASDVHVFLSKDKYIASKIPGHQLLNPVTPQDLASAHVVPVEVAGDVQVVLDLGPGGPVTGTTEVSGFEILVPRDMSIVNVSQMVASSQGPRLGLTVKARGLKVAPSLRLFHPGLWASNDKEALVPITLDIPSDSVAVNVPLNTGFEEMVLKGGGIDSAGNFFNSKASLFAFTRGMVHNSTPLADSAGAWSQFNDPGGLNVGPGRFMVPAVINGLDLLYPANFSDNEISDHLRTNGLSPIAIKRNAGTLVTTLRLDGRDALAEALTKEIDTGLLRLWDPDDPPTPLLDQAVDGEDLLYRDVVDAGFEAQWLGSFDLDFPGTPDEKRLLGIMARARIIQKVRAQLGLPPNETGKSLEYQAYHDAAVWTFSLDVLNALITIYGGAAIRGLFLLRGAGVAAEVTAAGVELTEPTVILATNLKHFANYEAVTNTTTNLALLGNYRGMQMLRRADWVDDALRTAAFDQMINLSAELGIGLGREFVEQLLKIPFDSAHHICCDGVPRTGGAATGVFDDVFVDDTGRIVILEAKGGLSFKNPASRFAAGRKVLLADGSTAYAMQGTREYVEGVALQMSVAGRTAQHRAAGQRILQELAERSGKVEYYFATARWSTRRPASVNRTIGRGLAWSVAPVVRVFKAVF